ncbi:MAG: phosphate acyltransferase PlsX [Dissulfurispiraceae bacterium]|jgi:glycerol-3-phosphate acyltransferase PlsX|nr:phosphate acyltransferase PlsX [Dissulfurispiraceae bacterium]
MKIALDAMGGDYAPEVTVAGAIEAVNEYDIEVVLVGDREQLEESLSDKKYPADRITIHHSSEVVLIEDQASVAIRKKKDSSVRSAIELVKEGAADAVVSAGHSGATMATALYVLGKIKSVDRPAIATKMPSLEGFFILLDAGANVDCKPENLRQFSLMGNAYAETVYGVKNPRVALLSIGEEDTKGNELTKEAFKLIKSLDVNFIGNIEGKDIFHGGADVVVCDGFIGNIVLKVAEGLAESIIKMLKREVARAATGRIGYLMLKSTLKNFRKQTDYSEHGGAPLLGINGVCLISHGRSTSKAIKNAIRTASEMAACRVHEAIARSLDLKQKS